MGWKLNSQLAPGTRCALEHGGAAPAIVAKDADLDDAIPLLAKGGFYHAGQVCVSVQRVFAHESIARDVAALCVDQGFDFLQAPVKCVTAPHTPVPFSKVLEQAFIPSAQDVLDAVGEMG